MRQAQPGEADGEDQPERARQRAGDRVDGRQVQHGLAFAEREHKRVAERLDSPNHEGQRQRMPSGEA